MSSWRCCLVQILSEARGPRRDRRGGPHGRGAGAGARGPTPRLRRVRGPGLIVYGAKARSYERDQWVDPHALPEQAMKVLATPDVVVTNPPYSADHPSRLLDFLARNRYAQSLMHVQQRLSQQGAKAVAIEDATWVADDIEAPSAADGALACMDRCRLLAARSGCDAWRYAAREHSLDADFLREHALPWIGACADFYASYAIPSSNASDAMMASLCAASIPPMSNVGSASA